MKSPFEPSVPVRRGLVLVGASLVAVGAVMAAMPFAGALIGVPFDGAETWEWNRNRLLLHVLPGLAGVALGVIMLAAHRRGVREHTGYPPWLCWLAPIALVVGLWNGLGPWLLELALPASESSALMFHSVPDFERYSGLHQVLLQGVCHWLPGYATLVAAYATYRLIGMLPPLVRPRRLS